MEIKDKIIAYHPESDSFVAVGKVTEIFPSDSDLVCEIRGELNGLLFRWDFEQLVIIFEDYPEYRSWLANWQKVKHEYKRNSND